MPNIKQQFAYNSAGRKSPVFLCPEFDGARVFVDVPKGTRVFLEYSFDPKRFIENRPRDVLWHEHESGVLESDFACELLGPPTAVRVKVGEVCSVENVVLVVEQVGG